jgi:hypothetical protein
MTSYICETCGKDFKYKWRYYRHILNKVKPCNIKYTCIFCDYVFSRNKNLERHLKICKIKNENINVNDNNNDNNNNNNNKKNYKFKKENLELKNNNLELKLNNLELKQKLLDIENLIRNNNDSELLKNMDNKINISNMNVNVNISNNINNGNMIGNNIVNNNIISNDNNDNINDTKTILVNYKDEKLDDDDMIEILSNKNPILCAIEKIHCNKNKPEQHNVLINDKTRNNILVYEDEKWILKEKDNVLKNIFFNTFNKINEKIAQNIIENGDSKNTINDENTYKNIKIENFTNEHKFFFKNLKNMIKHTSRVNNIVYNNKPMINETKNKNDLIIKKNFIIKKKYL